MLHRTLKFKILLLLFLILGRKQIELKWNSNKTLIIADNVSFIIINNIIITHRRKFSFPKSDRDEKEWMYLLKERTNVLCRKRK